MSGSGGGGYGGGFERSGVSCEDLIINTQLSSPQSAVVGKLHPNDLLDVAIQQHGNQSVVVVLHKGQLAGGVASPDVQQLRECIQQGTIYSARVVEISGASVRIRITAAKAP